MSKKSTFGISVICIVATAFLVMLSVIIPALSVVFMIGASVMTAYCFTRCGYVASVVNVLISAGLALFFGELNPQVLLIPALGLVPGIVSGMMTKAKSEYYSHLLGVIISFFLVIAVWFYMTFIMSGIGIDGMFEGMTASLKSEFNKIGTIMNDTLNDALRENAEMLQFDLTAQINEFVDAFIVFMKLILPSVMIVFAMIAGFIHFILFKVLMDKTGSGKMDYVHMDGHCAPRSMAYVYIVASIIIMFSGGSGAFSIVLNNATVILDVILAFCGFSFIESKFKNMLRFKGLRWLIYVSGLLISGNMAIQVLSVIGMFDSFMDFRGIRKLGE